MNFLETCRYIFQFIAFLLLVYQMSSALFKYISRPTVVSTKHIRLEEVALPTVTICTYDQYDWFAAKNLGYTYRSNYHYGLLDGATGQLSWGGVEGLDFEETKKMLYKTNFDAIIVHNVSLTDKFIIPHGNCKELKNYNTSEILMVNITKGHVNIFVTDPAKTLYYKVSTLSMVGDEISLVTDETKPTKIFEDYLLHVKQTVLDPVNPDQECTNYQDESRFSSQVEGLGTINRKTKIFSNNKQKLPLTCIDHSMRKIN